MSSLQQIGSAISNIYFVKEELEKAHAFIHKHQLPVQIIDNDLHKQIIELEHYAGSNHFQKGLLKYKTVNRLLLTLSTVLLLIVFGVAGAEYFWPELEVGQYLLDFLFDQFLLSMLICGVLFGAVLVLALVRAILARRLHGKVLAQAWASIVNKTQAI